MQYLIKDDDEPKGPIIRLSLEHSGDKVYLMGSRVDGNANHMNFILMDFDDEAHIVENGFGYLGLKLKRDQ